ncbi:MAG TPA: pyruvate kinase [Thermoanaerobacterales bacterium]|nr:pyruvate kinase [Thermoanaerobacterales bacterium]
MRKTKIICTLGPATDNYEIIKKLVKKGMDIARLNFSHGTHEEYKKKIEIVRKVSKELGKSVGILVDTKGPEIRIGTFKNKRIFLKPGQKFTLICKDIIGDESRVSVSYQGLSEEIKVGHVILIDDGLIELEVINIIGDEIICEVLNGGELSDRKGVNVPGLPFKLPVITQKDIDDILFGINMDVDFIAASFIRKSSDVLTIRKILEDNNAEHINIISKIENREGVDNTDEIIKVSDGIMVARGDLGVEIPPEEVPLIQKKMIDKCNSMGKPVITATQMLDSMMRNPRPTRAEASDVANAILDGTDAIMLSGETAVGKYPVESIEIMARIAEKAETAIGVKRRIAASKGIMPPKTVTDSISHATVTIAEDLDAAAIITSTNSGYTARMVSKYRPMSGIIAVTPHESVLRKLTLVWGVIPIQVPQSFTTDEMFEKAVQGALKAGLINSGDLVVITAGIPVGVTGTTNLLKVHIAGDVIARGIGIGNKPIIGKAFVAKTVKETEAMEKGDILITTSTDRDFVPIMERAGGIITEEGGLTSHAAVVGLELKIPVVVGAEGATDKIPHGSLITIDPVRGLIYKGKTKVL